MPVPGLGQTVGEVVESLGQVGEERGRVGAGQAPVQGDRFGGGDHSGVAVPGLCLSGGQPAECPGEVENGVHCRGGGCERAVQTHRLLRGRERHGPLSAVREVGGEAFQGRCQDGKERAAVLLDGCPEQ